MLAMSVINNLNRQEAERGTSLFLLDRNYMLVMSVKNNLRMLDFCCCCCIVVLCPR